MQAPKVSILVPICNVERYLRQCLDGLVNQTLEDIEVICINDGSTDSSLSIIREYERRDQRIVVIDKPNSGYGDSMNRGIDTARGEYVGIVESDDFAVKRTSSLCENSPPPRVRSSAGRNSAVRGLRRQGHRRDRHAEARLAGGPVPTAALPRAGPGG